MYTKKHIHTSSKIEKNNGLFFLFAHTLQKKHPRSLYRIAAAKGAASDAAVSSFLNAILIGYKYRGDGATGRGGATTAESLDLGIPPGPGHQRQHAPFAAIAAHIARR
jgi:hypothetical protein